MRRQLAPALLTSGVLLAAFALWSALVLGTPWLAGLDVTSLPPGTDLTSTWGQLQLAVSFVLHPFVCYPVLIVLAAWAHRRRLRNLGNALLLTVPLGWGGELLLKELFHRPRPHSTEWVSTTVGWGYPSGHVIANTLLAIMIVVVTVVIRRGPVALWAARILGALLLVVIAYNRWALRAHYLTDIVGGALWGGAAASLALLIARVHVVTPWAGTTARRGGAPRVAVVVNPTKVGDWETLRKHVDGAARGHGWGSPLWLETREDDPGRTAAAVALDNRADLVLVAGGDGTVRNVAHVLSGTGVAMAVLPAGTGNLLARNLGIPLDVADALDTALDGRPLSLDVVQVRADGGAPEASLVMAGMGVDALVMSETDPDLKRAVGPAAYVVAALGVLHRSPFEVTVTADDGPPARHHVGLALVANVGQLFGGIQLVPDAEPGDGLLDLLLAEAAGPGEWANMAGRVLSGAGTVEGIERGQAARLLIETDEPRPYQIDGDTAGACCTLEAVVVPSALTVMVPR